MQQERPLRVRLAAARPGDELADAIAAELRAAGIDVQVVSPSGALASDGSDLQALRQKWEQAVAPHQKDLQAAAEAHYAVISELRRRQQLLIDEADRIGRTIEQLEKQYQDLTTPRPAGADR
jgi:hypothetical protein